MIDHEDWVHDYEEKDDLYKDGRCDEANKGETPVLFQEGVPYHERHFAFYNFVISALNSCF